MAFLKRQDGQAAVEFFFVMLGVFLILGFMVVLFAFAQDVFFENTRARADLLKAFHDDVQFRISGDKTYSLGRRISVKVRSVPYLERLISGVPEFRRTLSLRGGTAPTILEYWGAAEECALGAVLVQQETPIKTGLPIRWLGDEIGAGAALAICETYHYREFR